MSEIIATDSEQDTAGQAVDDGMTADDGQQKSLKQQLFSMDIYTAMLLLALLFIIFSGVYLLGVLRTYSPSFPFGGFPWNASEFQTLMFW